MLAIIVARTTLETFWTTEEKLWTNPQMPAADPHGWRAKREHLQVHPTELCSLVTRPPINTCLHVASLTVEEAHHTLTVAVRLNATPFLRVVHLPGFFFSHRYRYTQNNCNLEGSVLFTNPLTCSKPSSYSYCRSYWPTLLGLYWGFEAWCLTAQSANVVMRSTPSVFLRYMFVIQSSRHQFLVCSGDYHPSNICKWVRWQKLWVRIFWLTRRFLPSTTQVGPTTPRFGGSYVSANTCTAFVIHLVNMNSESSLVWQYYSAPLA